MHEVEHVLRILSERQAVLLICVNLIKPQGRCGPGGADLAMEVGAWGTVEMRCSRRLRSSS